MTEEEEETGVSFTEENHEVLEMLRRKKLASDDGKKATCDGASTSSSFKGNFVTYAQSNKGTLDTRALASISTTGTSEWIVDSGASQHVTGASHEFSTYTHLAAPENIQTTDGTAQPVVGKGIVKCTKSISLANVLHAPSFPINLLSISAIILQLKCVVYFDIPKVTFQEKETGRRLGTGSWHSGLWYLDRDVMDTALASMVDRVGAGGSSMSVEDELLLYHQHMGHSSLSILSILYLSMYKKSDKHKLICDVCEFGKHTRSSYVSSGNRSACVFYLIHSDV